MMLALCCPKAGVHSNAAGREAFGPMPRVSTSCASRRTPTQGALCARVYHVGTEIALSPFGGPDLSCSPDTPSQFAS